jgi:TolB-like protein/tetratricopeptide (TPR) repeat protein
MVSKLSGFLAELKRRKVYRVAVAYVVLGAGIIGLGDAAIPSWAQIQVPVVVAVLVGLPIALVLAWAYEVRSEEPHSEPEHCDPITPGAVAPNDASIVVLPFDNLSPDPGDAYFSNGLTEEVISDLSGLRSLRVISRTSAMLMKDSGKDVRTIGQELAVRYVLEGSVRKAGERLRVTAQLIDAASDAHVWSDRYDGELGDVFSIQERVARSIADALHMELTPEEAKELAAKPVSDVAAYECVLRARHDMWTGTEESIQRAIASLDTAQGIVGGNVVILSALSEAHFLLPHVTGVGMEDLPGRMKEMADRILLLDPGAARGHFTKGLAAVKRPWGVREAMKQFRKATELDPTDTLALGFHSYWAGVSGCVKEALAMSERLLTLDPLSPLAHMFRAWSLMFAGDLEAAVPLAERAFNMGPDSTYWRWSLAIVQAQSRNMTEVVQLAAPVAESREDNWALSTAMLGAATVGRSPDEFLTPQLMAAARDDETFSWVLAQSFAQMGQLDEAAEWLENAISCGFVNAEFLGSRDVLLVPLRVHPRFEELITTARKESEKVQLDR